MAKKSISPASDEAQLSNEAHASTNPGESTVVPDTPANEETAPTEDSQEKQYSVNIKLNITDRETQEVKYSTKVQYSMPIEKISAMGNRRTEYKLFIDNIYFGRVSKYFGPKMFLKTKSQKDYTFKNGEELKKFMLRTAAEFGAVRADMDEVDYKDLIQSFEMNEENLEPEQKTEYTPAAKETEQTMFAF